LFARVVVKTGAPRIRLHDLRHLHATLALEAGVAPRVLADRLVTARRRSPPTSTNMCFPIWTTTPPRGWLHSSSAVRLTSHATGEDSVPTEHGSARTARGSPAKCHQSV
jgi:integrase